MNLFIPKNIQFLKSLKCKIESLPWKIWEYDDIKNKSKYSKKRKKLEGEVMHIQNQLRSYVVTRYCEGELLHEYNNYSFFTQGFIADTFNELNNEAWSKEKKSYLYFTDKLIDFAEAEEIINSIDWRKNITKWFILFVVMGGMTFLLFAETMLTEQIDTIVGHDIKHRLQFILLATMVTSNLLWYKNWRDILPITTSIIGALLGLNL